MESGFGIFVMCEHAEKNICFNCVHKVVDLLREKETQIKAMRPVVEAAIAWKRRSSEPPGDPRPHLIRIVQAVEGYEKATAKERCCPCTETGRLMSCQCPHHLPTPDADRPQDRKENPVAADDLDTFQLWTNPGCRVVCRLLKDGRYVLYRVDDPGVRLLLTAEEIPMIAELLKTILGLPQNPIVGRR